MDNEHKHPSASSWSPPPDNISVGQEVLGDLPQKVFRDTSVAMESKPLELPTAAESGGKGVVGQALERVLRLLQVGSKRFLTNKVVYMV